MPAQTKGSEVLYYAQYDTAPPLRVCLKDGAGDPIDLTGLAVTITIVSATGQVDIERDACTIDPDQTSHADGGNRGFVNWEPGASDLAAIGSYNYSFEVTYLDATKQTIPPDRWLRLVVSSTLHGLEP